MNQLLVESITAKDIFNAARKGDSLSRDIVEETAYLLGMGIANIIDLVNPEVVILGGNIGRQGDLLLPGVRKMIDKWAQPASAKAVQIAVATMGEDAGLYGAGYSVMLRSKPEIEAITHKG